LRLGETGSAEAQMGNIRRVCNDLAELVHAGYRIAITHGNGPQVGDIFLKNELARGVSPPMPLDVCGAQSQGMLGYMLQQSMQNALRARGLNLPVVTVVTQVLVDQRDPAFANPTKPIGPFYGEEQAARLGQERGWRLVADAGRGYRRVVPSPRPVKIVEGDSIQEIWRLGAIVIGCGGGGIPVIAGSDGELTGVEAVIDKDYCAALLGEKLGAEVLLILADVEKVSLNYRKPNQKDLDQVTVEEAKRFLAEGHFPPGSMGPKVEAAISFLESGGERVIVTSVERAGEALGGRAGTSFYPGSRSSSANTIGLSAKATAAAPRSRLRKH